jgi:hypothetical protein
MRVKRNSFWTFVFSLLPGAGHMFMGFMKLGISMMATFFFIIFLSSWLNFGPLMYILPILWFYSFFDCINKRYASDDEFMRFEDNYLFSIDKLIRQGSGISDRGRLIAGAALLLLGIYMVWVNFIHMFAYVLPQRLYNAISNLTYLAPQLIIGAAVIALGIWLVMGRRKETDDNA